jgi:hypothetical protein
MTKILLLAVQLREDVTDVSLPVRQLLSAVAAHGDQARPAHVSVYDVLELDADALAQAFAPDNPNAFQTVPR